MIQSLNLADAQRRLPLDWNPHDFIRDHTVADKIAAALDDESDSELRITVDIPGPTPTVEDLSSHLYQIARHVRLATALAYLPEWDASDYTVDAYGPWRPIYGFRNLRIVGVTIGSVKVEITLTGKEAARFLRRGVVPPPAWKKRLATALIVVVAAGITGGSVVAKIEGHDVRFPTSSEVEEAIRRACGSLPPGSEITVRVPGVELQVPCGEANAGSRD
jgi:hypothetical protein